MEGTTTSPFSAHPKTACITCTASSASVSGSCWAKILIGISKCSQQRFTIPPSTRWRSSSSGHATQSIAARLSFLRLLPRVLSSGGRPFHGSPRSSLKRRRNAQRAGDDLRAQDCGSGAIPQSGQCRRVRRRQKLCQHLRTSDLISILTLWVWSVLRKIYRFR